MTDNQSQLREQIESQIRELLDHCECRDMHPLNFDDNKFGTIWWHKGDSGNGSDGSDGSDGSNDSDDTLIADISCRHCAKHYILTTEDIARYEHRRVTCDNCGNHVDITGVFEVEGSSNGIFEGKLVKMNMKNLNIEHMKNKRCHYLCRECTCLCEYHEIPKYIYCDLCHSEHERFHSSDTQGEGLCGKVMRNCTYPTLWTPFKKYELIDGYVINCEYPSKYDACDDSREFIKFSTPELPEGFKIGMNICDECITNLIENGTCIRPTYVEDQKVPSQ
jgi:hypothetical protein